MPVLGILSIIFLLIVLYFFLLPYLKRGETEALYLIMDGKNTFLLVLMKIETFIVSKGGAILINRYRLKKINLDNGKVIFNIPYRRIVAELLQSYANILGCTPQHIYISLH